MLDPLSLTAAGGLVLLGYALGAVQRRTRNRDKAGAHCDCKHSLSYHDPETGACHGIAHYRESSSGPVKAKRCTCQRYVGPEPLTNFWTPPAILPTDGKSR